MSLAQHVHDLTRTHYHAGQWKPALLEQLRHAVKPGHDGGTGDGSNGAPSPINLSAVDLLQAITTEANTELWEMRNRRIALGTLEDAIQGLAPATNPEWDAYLGHVTADWCDQIRALLNPVKPRRRLNRPCPACGVTLHGEERKVALTLNCWGPDETMLHPGLWDAKCEACGAAWAGDQLAWLTAALNPTMPGNFLPTLPEKTETLVR